MSKAAAPVVDIAEEGSGVDPASDGEVRSAAIEFCEALPYRRLPYSSRNWGGLLHSLCSYQGKLKPAIAHFLIRWFTSRKEVVLDPMAGVGTIPLEARLQDRVGIAGDLSELAAVVSRAKLEAFDADEVAIVMRGLEAALRNASVSDSALVAQEHGGFGLNGRIEEYFERRTLREILLARRFFRESLGNPSAAEAIVLTSLLHILHGNRPYALSRRSHPMTPFKPTGAAEYRPLITGLTRRLERITGPLSALSAAGHAYRTDYKALPLAPGSVDAVITSPPFAQSLRFFSTNWMRLWLCGWEPEDFHQRPDEFLERRQLGNFEDAYQCFLDSMHVLLRPGGLLIMHLGETRKVNMAERLTPLLKGRFSLIYVGRECVADTESHGLTDKGATRAHSFVFARAI
jgi:RMKL-like, methyltransferase domain